MNINKDECYIIDLCDKALNSMSIRSKTFEFLKGDPDKNGTRRKLPVDAYYEEYKLVIEYNERQHTEGVNFFDKPDKMTVSGVSRGEQRKIYDQRRKDVLPKHGIELIVLSYFDFNYNNQKRLIRSESKDLKIIINKLSKYIR